MKRILLFSTAALSLLWASCYKNDDVDPVTGYNSKIVLSGVHLYNVQFADTVFGRVTVGFTDQNDSLYKSISNTVYILTAVSDQTIHFDTPLNPKTMDVSIIFNVNPPGFYDSASVANFTYVKDGQTLINKPMNGQLHVNYTF